MFAGFLRAGDGNRSGFAVFQVSSNAVKSRERRMSAAFSLLKKMQL